MARVCAMMPAYGTMTARSFDPAARRISGFGRWATRMSTPSLGSFSVLRYTVKPGNCLLRIRASSCSPASMKRKMRRLMRRTNARRSCLGRWAPARHIRLTASGSTSPSASAPPSAKSVVSLAKALKARAVAGARTAWQESTLPPEACHQAAGSMCRANLDARAWASSMGPMGPEEIADLRRGNSAENPGVSGGDRRAYLGEGLAAARALARPGAGTIRSSSTAATALGLSGTWRPRRCRDVDVLLPGPYF
eukprot:scaffold47_cov258-Pinguiococcus_pyrenoidosus.AAC.99